MRTRAPRPPAVAPRFEDRRAARRAGLALAVVLLGPATADASPVGLAAPLAFEIAPGLAAAADDDSNGPDEPARAPVPTIPDVQISRRRARALRGPGGRAAIYAVADAAYPFDGRREPLLVVHGLSGAPAELADVVAGLRGRVQPYVLVYDDLGRRTGRAGDELAAALAPLAAGAWRGRDVTIVAHSLGGIIARRALDRLALDPSHPLDALGHVRVIAVDSPWHGYAGPPDTGAGRALMALARPFLPDGLEDLRARGAFFAGDPSSRDPVERAGLYGVELPPQIDIELVFAASGHDVLDYTESVLAGLPARVAAWYVHDEPVRGDPRLVNFWRALVSSAQYTAFRADLEPLAAAGRLDEGAVRAALARHFPRFPGDHMSVLAAQRGGLVEHLATRLHTRDAQLAKTGGAPARRAP